MAAVGGLAPETPQEPATRPTRPGRGAMDWSDVRVFLAVAREGSAPDSNSWPINFASWAMAVLGIVVGSSHPLVRDYDYQTTRHTRR